jgi:hypothetical protein
VGVRPGSVARSGEKVHLFQEVTRGLDSLSICVVQPVDVKSIEIAEYTMHPVALFELLLHRKRLTARRRGKTPIETGVGLAGDHGLNQRTSTLLAGCWLIDAQHWCYSRLGP